MATTTDTPDLTPLQEAIRSISESTTADMQTFAAQQAARTARLTAVRDRLSKHSGTPPATLQKLNSAISASTATSQTLGGLAARIARRPSFSSTDVAVFGQVEDASGAAAPDVYVRMTDNAGRAQLGSRVKTDAAGDFSLVFKACELPAGTASLVVVAEDANGTRLAASNPVAPKAGSPVYVELALSAPQSTGGSGTKSGPKKAPPFSSR